MDVHFLRFNIPTKFLHHFLSAQVQIFLNVQEVEPVREPQRSGGAGRVPHPQQGGGELDRGGALRDPRLEPLPLILLTGLLCP